MRYIITIILVSALLQSNAQVTDALSNSLLSYERDYWTAQTDSAKFNALLNKANLDRGAGLYGNAVHELFRAEKYTATNNQKAGLEYEKMINYFLNNQYSFCSGIVIDSTKIRGRYKEYLTMKLYALIEMEHWDTCKAQMVLLCKSSDTLTLTAINNLPITYNYKDPIKAKHMSAILPGLGETYAGYPFKGITSFVLNAGFLAFTGYNVATKFYVTSFVSGFYPFLKFHTGGKRLSSILAEEHNNEEVDKLKQKYRAEANLLLQ